jgi:hypothetical protein
MNQIIRELKRQVVGEKLEPEELKGLIRAGYVYRNGDGRRSRNSRGPRAPALIRPSVPPSGRPPSLTATVISRSLAISASLCAGFPGASHRFQLCS